MDRIYIDLIKNALKAIAPRYFRLSTTYEPSGIVRERVFCYELYHQVRSLMKDEHKISINGEIDKRGHVDFAPAHRKNPDFVFHIPGTHKGNTVVLEVKGRIDYSPTVMQNDFETLLTFVSQYSYQSGIFLLYNHTIAELEHRHHLCLGRVKSHPAASSIIIISLNSPENEPEECLLSDL